MLSFLFFLSSADVGLKQKNAGEEISKLDFVPFEPWHQMLFLVKCANIGLGYNCLCFLLCLFLFTISFMKGVFNFSFLKN